MSSLGGRSREVLAQGGSTVFSIITQTSNCLCQKMLNMLLSLNFQSKHDSNIDRKAYFAKKWKINLQPSSAIMHHLILPLDHVVFIHCEIFHESLNFLQQQLTIILHELIVLVHCTTSWRQDIFKTINFLVSITHKVLV